MGDQEAGRTHLQAAEAVIDIDQELIFSDMSKMLDARRRATESTARPCTIYKVPDDIRNVDPEAFEPQIISIGPFHRGKPKLLPMEGIKWQFLLDLIDRHPSNSLDKYITAVSNPSFVQEIAKCYSVQVIGADAVNAFVQTMVLDGCFIIEFFVRSLLGSCMGELIESRRNRFLVESDLLLIENQIPFCVLQVLFDSTSPGKDVDHSITFTNIAMSILSRDMDGRTPSIPQDIHHLLHLRYTCCLPTPAGALQTLSVNQAICNIKHMIRKALLWVLSLLIICLRTAPYEAIRVANEIGSATELYKAGISFEPKRGSVSYLDVTFRASDGVVEIPPLPVWAATVSQLRNMVAFERYLPSLGSHFTSFVALMDSLIDTPADVALLVKSGVMENMLVGDEEVAHLFNTLGKGSFLPPYMEHYLKELFKDVNEHCAVERHRWKASLMHTYFSNPWSAISLFAAIILLLLTIVQTFFTVFAYACPP